MTGVYVGQVAWDNKQTDYRRIVAGEEVPRYRQEATRRWANVEGLEPPQPPPAEVEPVQDLCAELGVSVRVVDGPPRKYLQPEVTEL